MATVANNHLPCGKLAGQSGSHCSIPAGRFLRWARQSASLRRHARCLPASCALARANVLSWNAFIITKLIRGCRMTYTAHLAWQDEGEMRDRDAALTPMSQDYLVTQGRTHTHTQFVAVYTAFLIRSVADRAVWLCLSMPPSPQAGKIIIFYKGRDVHILGRFLTWAVVLVGDLNLQSW